MQVLRQNYESKTTKQAKQIISIHSMKQFIPIEGYYYGAGRKHVTVNIEFALISKSKH